MKFQELSTGDVFIVRENGVKYAKMGCDKALYYANNGTNGRYKVFKEDDNVIQLSESILSASWWKPDPECIQKTYYLSIDDISGPNYFGVRVMNAKNKILIHPENTEIFDGYFPPISIHYKDGIPIINIYNDKSKIEPLVIELDKAKIPVV